MFSDMDHNLREIGVSDLSVGKRVRAMWEAFHGRAKVYASAMEAADRAALEAALDAQCLAWRGTGRRGRVAGPASFWRSPPIWPGQPLAALGVGRGAQFLPAAEASR